MTEVGVIEALESMVGPVDHLDPVDRGYAHNNRMVATLRGGGSVFAKQAVDELTAKWLRREHRMYEALGDRSFVPAVVGWADGERPLLVLEDLSGATWPPPWDSALIDAVLTMLGEVAASGRPEGLPRLVDGERADEGWHQVEADPAAFLSLGLCDARWLEEAAPVLCRAAAAAPRAGDDLVHGDVRSDNLCFRSGGAVLFDWNFGAVGNAEFDVAFWLPSLAAEGGPPPEVVRADCPAELAAYVSGFFACRAGGPDIPHAPLVRRVQRQQLETALPWAARLLGLPEPG
jgi:Ser/Thr protein kinase RdoA (MazF antagonist)